MTEHSDQRDVEALQPLLCHPSGGSPCTAVALGGSPAAGQQVSGVGNSQALCPEMPLCLWRQSACAHAGTVSAGDTLAGPGPPAPSFLGMWMYAMGEAVPM